MVEGKIKGRMEEQGGKFFLAFFFLFRLLGWSLMNFRCANDLVE
jgi:hypothetical protein